MAKKTVKKWYKITGYFGDACSGGHGTYDLPVNGKPGKWMPTVRNPEACERGYHLVPSRGIGAWANGGRILWLAEPKGKSHAHSMASDGKVAFASARLVKKVGEFPLNWVKYDDDGGRKSGSEIILELTAPVKYAAEKKARAAKAEADKKKAEASALKKRKAEEAKRKKNRDALKKKWKACRDAWRPLSQQSVGFHPFLRGWATAKGIKMTSKQALEIYWSFQN